MPIIRAEQPQDVEAIHRITELTFESAVEADVVRALRQSAQPFVSLVAVEADAIVGHIAFSPATLPARPELSIAGLGPMAVIPSHQRQGIGSLLIRAGLEEVRRAGFSAVIVLGHADYYPRFGFVPASTFGLKSEYDVPDDVFMALELEIDALRERGGGMVRYHPAFADA